MLISKNSGSARSSSLALMYLLSRSVSGVNCLRRKPIFVKPFEGMGVTVPSISPLNFSHDENGSLTSHLSQPCSIRHLPFLKVRVALGPPFTSKPMETGFLVLTSSLASALKSQRFSSVPKTAYMFMYANVFASVKMYSSLECHRTYLPFNFTKYAIKCQSQTA